MNEKTTIEKLDIILKGSLFCTCYLKNILKEQYKHILMPLQFEPQG